MREFSDIKWLTAANLKWIAVVTMLVDHISASLLEWYVDCTPSGASDALAFLVSQAMRCIGRLSFPLFIFLLVEGFFHTRSRARYLGRLSAFALISELPFDLARVNWRSSLDSGAWIRWDAQNVFFTLAIGFATICAFEVLRKRAQGRGAAGKAVAACGGIALAVGGCLLATIVCCDYGWAGVLAIVVAYLLRPLGRPWFEMAAILVPLSIWSLRELFALPAILIALLYNGEKGKGPGKWFFYMFYPGHLLVLGITKVLLVFPR